MQFYSRIVLIIFLSCSCITHDLFAQKKAKISNVKYDLMVNSLIVQYDLLSKSDEKKDVLLFFWDNDYNPIVPRSLKGDVGLNVPTGKSKQIQWNLLQDNYMIAGRLKPELILKDEFYGRGSSMNAFYSVLIPGLGDYFVADHKTMLFKPYLRTTVTLSLMGLGIRATQLRTRESIYSYWVNPRTGREELRFTGNGDYKYWLFPYDNYVFLSAGAALWIYDIIWVATRGGRNAKLNKAFRNFDLNYDSNSGAVVKYRLNF